MPASAARSSERVEHRDERLGAFEAEALLPEVLRVQEALERLGRVQPLEDAALLAPASASAAAPSTCVLDPLLLVGLLDVHVLDADRARVRVAQHAEDVAQRHRLAAELPAPRPPVGNSRSRSQIVRP